MQGVHAGSALRSGFRYFMLGAGQASDGTFDVWCCLLEAKGDYLLESSPMCWGRDIVVPGAMRNVVCGIEYRGFGYCIHLG